MERALQLQKSPYALGLNSLREYNVEKFENREFFTVMVESCISVLKDLLQRS